MSNSIFMKPVILVPDHIINNALSPLVFLQVYAA